MKAALFSEVGQKLSIATVPDPAPRDGHVVIQVAHCGICGSDLHMTDRPGYLASGAIMGHEFAGTVVALGRHVGGDWKIGDRVSAMPLNACAECEGICRRGLYALCPQNQFTGVGNIPGAYAEYVASNAAMLRRLPAGVGFQEGALVEPLAVAFHAVDLAQLRPGSNVLILGAGPIGVGAALFARLTGARHVVISEPMALRRNRALECGATATINPKTENVALRFREIAGDDPDIVFECVGVPGLLQQAMELIRPHSLVMVVGVCMEPDTIQPIAGMMREARLHFTNSYGPRDFDAVIDFLAQERIAPQPMITRIVGFDELPDAFEALRKPSAHCKILIDPVAAS